VSASYRARIQRQVYLTVEPEHFNISYAVGKSSTSSVTKDLITETWKWECKGMINF
jgi:hypothetical protein